MQAILKTCFLEPMDYTYLGIGSSPHLLEGETLDPKRDQLIPVCFHEMIQKDKIPMRILHFDPHFADQEKFLLKYFDTWSLTPFEVPGGMGWINDHMEVIVIPEHLEHIEHYWFFEALCDTILNTRGKLVIQEYTGYELTDLNQKLYQACDLQEKYKRRILLDMTFGTDQGCCTDMTKAQPFYEYNGDFLNIHFLNESDARRFIGISEKLDTLLKQKYRGFYYQTLNTMHVDYRRKLKGEILMYGSQLYTEKTSPDEIMRILQMKLKGYLDILLLLRVIPKETLDVVQKLFTDYKNHDPYKWYDSVHKVVP